MTRLLAIAGESRSGKGTCAAVFAEEAAAAGLTSLERQLSDNGKWHLARIFKPEISRVDAVAWFEYLKSYDAWVEINSLKSIGVEDRRCDGDVPLQKFLQHGLQQGGRDIFGEHFWTDMIIPLGLDWFDHEFQVKRPWWTIGFFDNEARKSCAQFTDLAIISDLRQVNEAVRVLTHHGQVIQLVRPHVEDQYRTGSDHITERMLPLELVDHVIANDGDLEHLKETARMVFHKFVLPWLKGDQ